MSGPSLRRAAAAVLVLWAVGTFLGEGFQQAAAAGAVLLAALAWRAHPPARDVRAWALWTAAFAAWQAVSPAVALARGVAERWPRGARYGQVLDTAAGPAAALVAGVGVPWGALLAVLAGGWLTTAVLALYQHLVRWPFTPPAFLARLKLPVQRVYEDFGTPERPRFAAGGFHFHRLRLAHAAVALAGPTLAYAARARGRRALVAGLVLVGLLLSVYAAFARAALGVALVVCAGGALLVLRGRVRQAVLAVGALLVLAALATPGWRARIAGALGNVGEGGERRLAMSVGARLFRENPWTGVGFGNHREAALATAPETGINAFLGNDSHDVWLTVAAETGLVGVLLFLLAHVALARALWHRHRQGSATASGALLSLAAFHLLGLVHYLPFHSSVHLTFALVWGLGLAQPPQDGGAPAASPQPSVRR